MIGILLTGGIFTVDYKLKKRVDSTCLQGSSREFLGGKVILRNCHNEGAAFGMFKLGRERCLELSSMVLGGVLGEYLRQVLHGGRKLSRAGLAMILGGGLSNYADRRNKGYVTDYVSFGTKNEKIRKLVFNISDFCIMGGAFLWLLGSFLPKRKK